VEARVSFASPWWLFLGAIVVVGLAVGAVAATRRRRAALAAAGLDRTTGRHGLPLGVWLSITALAVLVVAVAGPAASVPVSRAAGTVIVAMDVSNSMGAKDVAPTRLDAAKKAATSFIDAQPSSVDVGVVAFENGGLTTDQPSADHAAAQAAIERLKVSGGTSLADAILTSLSAITGRTVAVGRDGKVPDIGYWGSATIVLIS
jgi:Ca-activated chloride channel family protein